MSEDAVCVAFHRDGCISGAFSSPGHTDVGKCLDAAAGSRSCQVGSASW